MTDRKDVRDQLSRALAEIIINNIADSLVEIEEIATEPVPPALVLHAITLAMVAAVPSLFVRAGWAMAYRKVAQSMLSAAQQAELLDAEPEGGIN